MTEGASTSDAQLVAGVLAGDRDAFAAVYDRYADRLHDFAYSMLRHREDAADAVADAFVTTAERLEQLRDADRLRPWLYAVVRRECLRRLKARSRTAYDGDEQLLELPDQALAPETSAEQADLRTLVWDAAAGLNERDRAMLDLHLRQGMDGAELGEAMGMSAANAYVGLSRLRDQVERSLGALLVARTSRTDCVELDEVLDDWDGDFTPLTRKRVARHVDGCEGCGRRRALLASPAALLAGVPAFAAPASLRDRVLEDQRLVSALTARAASGSVGRRITRAAVVAGVAALLVALAGTVVWQQVVDEDPVSLADAATATEPTASVAASPAAEPTTEAQPTRPAATLSPSEEPATEVSTSPTDLATETPTGSPSSDPTDDAPPALPGQLVATPRSLDLGATGSRSVTLRNTGGRPVSFEVTPVDGWLSAAPASGTLQPGQARDVTVSAQRGGLPEGASDGGLRVRWDRGTVQVGVTATREVAPVIGAPSVVRSFCPGSGRVVVLTVPISDESGIDSASVRWQGPEQSGTSVLGRSGDAFVASIGPFVVGGPVQLTFTATDTRGNTGRRSASISVDPCPQ